MDLSDISNEDFANLQRRLTDAGWLKSGFVGTGADWQFDFSNGREATLLEVKRFLNDIGPGLSSKDLILLTFMLDNTDEHGRAASADSSRE